ncbi:MAG: aldehyde ferredoxin oxidoreductase C-terminal domain-containing protein [Candidatus Bathyarchaeia archaeon]
MGLGQGLNRQGRLFPKNLLTIPCFASENLWCGLSLILSETKLRIMLDEYYRAGGWNNEGIPRKDKLQELGLNDVAEQPRINR